MRQKERSRQSMRMRLKFVHRITLRNLAVETRTTVGENSSPKILSKTFK